MEYDIGCLFGGVALLVAGILIVVYYQKIGDNLANGVTSYNKIKLFGLGACVLGIILIANLHIFLINLLVQFFRPTAPSP